MASPRGAEIAAVIQMLRDNPHGFDFFQAVRWLESRRTDLPRVGGSRRPQQDPVRFHQHVTLSFPPSALHRYLPEDPADASLPRLWVNCFGLLGPSGPMPLVIAEHVYSQMHNLGDRTLAAFLDLFNHRMIALFYRAWARGRQTISHDRPDDDWFADYVGSFLGLGGRPAPVSDSRPFRGRDVLPDDLKLYYSGRLSCPTKNREGLEAILADHLRLPVTIKEFIGQWILLAPQERCQLGGSARDIRLGETLVLGSRFWECQQKFRIRLGPMTWDDYRTLLPEGARLSWLTAWVRLYLGEELEWDVQLVLEAQEVPSACLGRQGLLGWSCWLQTQHPRKDPDDLVLAPGPASGKVDSGWGPGVEV